MGSSDSKNKKTVDIKPTQIIPEYKVMLIGDSSVGKTPLVYWFTERKVSQ